MSRNISREKRESLLAKIRELRAFLEGANATPTMKAYLSELESELKRQKFGLVFEEHKEEIDEILETHTPVLTEDKSLFINNGGPMNFLIEGDNLAALSLLEKTHKGKIDVIYIDPPYNTQKNEKDDFTYDDKKVDNLDFFAHSKWASFMKNRLEIAHRLLSGNGCIFISISDHEIASLRMIMDEIFGANNFLCNIIWNSTKSVTNTAVVSVSHTYTLVYFKNIDYIIKNRTQFRIPETGEGFSNPDNDPRGLWKADPFQVGGWRPNQQYEIVNPNTGAKYLPNPNCSWKNDYEKYLQLLADNRIVFGKNGTGGPQRKRFIWEAEERGRVVKTIWDDVETTTNGTQLLKKIFNGESLFSNPKPLELIMRILQLGSGKKSIILDFFAGSGTTGHAVMELNKQDGGNRKFILCTNNENGICRDVTYERIKTVITGKRKDGTTYGEPLPASLKYQRIDFIPTSEQTYYDYADELLLHIRELVELENAINFEGNNDLAILLTEDEVEQFFASEDKLNSVKTIYLGHDIALTLKQQQRVVDNNVTLNVIPEYYYKEQQI